MKVSEYERFRGVYCGLCHELKSRYGAASRFLVNYDFTFLAMLLSGETSIKECARRCPYNPGAKRSCPVESESLADAADYTVILAWWKLKDGAADSAFWGALRCRLLAFLFRRAYQKASARKTEFAAVTEENLRALALLETQKCASIDAVADRFALLLQSAADREEDSERRRILRELLYHLGRIVYILDAVDDLAEDEKCGGYNPLLFRFSLRDGKLDAEQEAELRQSLQHSHNCISAAFSLLPGSIYTGILSNTIYFGLPAVTQAVFSGTWKASSKQNKERSSL